MNPLLAYSKREALPLLLPLVVMETSRRHYGLEWDLFYGIYAVLVCATLVYYTWNAKSSHSTCPPEKEGSVTPVTPPGQTTVTPPSRTGSY